MQILNIHPV